MNVPWSPIAAEQFGADWLLAAIAPAGDFGRRARERERAYRTGDETDARVAIARVDRIARAVDVNRLQALRAALVATPDPASALVRAQSGGVLGDVDFFDLARFLDSLAEIEALARDDAFADVAIPRPDDRLRAALAPGVTAARTFYLDDAFSPELKGLREASLSRDTAFDATRTRLAERVARFAGLEHVRDGEFVIMRDRVRGPLPAEIRVLREAPTYVLCEIALDEPALAALTARDDAEAAVAVAEEAVRARLSACVATAAPALLAACDATGTLDLLIGRALFAQHYACVVPQIATDATFAFAEARYLPLADELASRGFAYSPISLELYGPAVITGPNMGGKSAALRTVGFLAACVAFGVPAPAAAATIPLVSEIAWLGLGAVSESEGLSAFGAEVVALRAFLETTSLRPLVLADEFARTTSPREGRALLVALLRTFARNGTLALASTHFSGVATASGVAHFAIRGLRALPISNGTQLDLATALRRIAGAMDYCPFRTELDAPVHSDALALAEALGLDPRLTSSARETLAGDIGSKP